MYIRVELIQEKEDMLEAVIWEKEEDREDGDILIDADSLLKTKYFYYTYGETK